MEENQQENFNRRNQLNEHINFLQLDQQILEDKLNDVQIPEVEKIREVTIFVTNFFRTVELFKSILGYTASHAEEGKIVGKDSFIANGLSKNIAFIKKELLPFIEKKPEYGEPMAEDALGIMKGKLAGIELLISGL